MAEIIFMKSIKLLIGLFCYFGTGILFIDQALDGYIREHININPAGQLIVFWLLVIFWVIKIVWFVYDKFYLERKERILKMDSSREKKGAVAQSPDLP